MNEATINLNRMSHEFQSLIRNQYQLDGTIFNISSYQTINQIESIQDTNGKKYVLSGNQPQGFTVKTKPTNPEKPKKCPSEKWAFQGGCWPFKKDGYCKHMEEQAYATT